MAPEKTMGPSTTITFAGIELDSVEMEARLPQNKLDKCKELISEFLKRRKVTLKEIQSLTGLLNFACAVGCSWPGIFTALDRLNLGHSKSSLLY